ncbi:Speckle-type POZ protein [Hordeum vulgare]|nr:Speckle-type POZ protein [Hordeum vulgare]
MSLPLDFKKHFLVIPMEFKMRTNNSSTWRVTVWLINDMVALDQDWNLFTLIHQIIIGYMVTFKLLTPNTLKVIVFNDDGVELVTKCKKHDEAFTMNI